MKWILKFHINQFITWRNCLFWMIDLESSAEAVLELTDLYKDEEKLHRNRLTKKEATYRTYTLQN